jgi:hypothetical protein
MSLVDSHPPIPQLSPLRVDIPHNPDLSPGMHTPPIKTTTNTVPHSTQPQSPAAASIPSTPGLDIPGAYPREESGTSARMSASTSAARQSASETTRSHLSAGLASNLRTSLLISRKFIRIFQLPSAGAKTVSLPSTEKEGVKPGEHCGGVGPLPGTISETSVAKLPDERLASARETGASAVSLPSQESTGVQPHEHHSSGVGPLPGSRSETSVAKLSDERAGVAREERAADAQSQERTEDTAAPSEGRAAAPSFGALGITNQGTQVHRIDPQNPESEERDDRRTDVRVSNLSSLRSEHGCGNVYFV